MKKTVLVLTILAGAAAVFLAAGSRSFYRSFLDKARAVKAAAGAQPRDLVTEKDLAGLPEPVARYMRFTGVVGKKKMSFLHIFHSGEFRTGANRPFMPIRGEYYMTTRKPSFQWFGRLRMAPGLTVAAFDSYFGGKGRMLVKILSVFTVADARSKETDISAFGRCVAEMSMAPTFFLDKRMVRWEAAGRDSARCTVTDAGLATEAEFFINPDGSPSKIVVMRYYDRGNGAATLEKFTGSVTGYTEQAGFRLPARLDGTWNLKEGDLHYASFIIDYYEME